MNDMVVIKGGQVLAPDASGFAAADVVIQNERISEIRPSGQEGGLEGATVVDVAGGYVMPGLIDAHAHLISRTAAEVTDQFVALGTIEGVLTASNLISAGVTTVRDAGCRHGGIHPLRAAIDRHVVPGPRAYVAGRNPTGTGGPKSWRNVVVDGPDAIRRAVREEWAAGADWIKLVISHTRDPLNWAGAVLCLTEDEMRVAVEEAHSKGMRVGCHCEGWEPARVAVRAGIDTLEHAALLADDVVEAMAERGTGYVPTVWAFSEDSGLSIESLSNTDLENLTRWQEEHRASIRRARDAGVVIAAGSDARRRVLSGPEVLFEASALTRAGLSAEEVLRALGVNGAVLLGRENELGTLQSGFFADLLVLRSNPLEDLGALAEVELVMKAGAIFKDQKNLAPALRAVAADSTVLEQARSGRWE